MAHSIATIGYEGSTMEAFIAALKRSHVTVLIDVREMPLSRKKGFSKNQLAEILRSFGIEYAREKPWGSKLDDMANCLSPVPLDEEMVQSENSGQVFMATRFIFSKKNDFTWERDFALTIGTDLYKPE